MTESIGGIGNVPLLDIKGLWLRFCPHNSHLGNRDWFGELQNKYSKDDRNLTEDEQEEVKLAYHLRGCLCWRLDYIINGKKQQIGQVIYLDPKKESEWKSRLAFGTYYLYGDKGLSFEEIGKCQKVSG